MFLDTVFQIKQQFIHYTKDSLRLVPVVTRKPKVLHHWLLESRKPQLIIIVLLVMVPSIITPVIDYFLSLIFSPVTAESLFGLIKTEEENPYLVNAQTIAHWLIWVGFVVISVNLYLRYLPITIFEVRKISNDIVLKADKLIKTNPSQSILLYDAAREWSIDELSEQEINTKISKLNSIMSGVGSKISNSDYSETATVVLPDAFVDSKKEIIAERYQVIDELGSGAMGTVYLAEDIKLNRRVALKQLSPLLSADKQQLARFRQEAHVLAKLSHPNIVQVYDFIEWNDLFLIAIELVEGGDLEEKLHNSDLLEIKEVIRLITQMAEGLAYAHEQGIIHRDLKPANILISKTGDIKITDFGIAKLTQSSIMTQLNTVMGSPAYMSPEQANGDSTDERTDIYSLGIVLYQMISGNRPFTGDAKSIIAQHISKVPAQPGEQRENLPKGLTALVMKMIEKDPRARYQSVVEVIEQLRQYKF